MIATCSLGAGMAGAAIGPGDIPGPPRVTDVSCSRTCAGIRTATEGSLVTISGRNLGEVAKVRFRNEEGGWLTVPPSEAAAQRVTATVPEGATTGVVRVRDAYERVATTPVKLKIVPAARIPEAKEFELRTAVATPRSVFFGGRDGATLRYSFAAKGPTEIRVDVVNDVSGQVVKSFSQPRREPFAGNEVTWSGRTSNGGAAPAGRYRFRVGPASGGAGKSKPKARFEMLAYRFPIAAKHSYGDGFGAGRGHQGQDIFARCGSPLVAARGGRVQANSYEGAAGWYVIIDAVGTRQDHIYMHLRKRSPLRKGKRVFTGQRVGQVGSTGRATGCHLHFEIWSAPGAWTDGGHPLPNVGPIVKRWDRKS